MKKILEWLYSLKVDKCLHFIAGIIVSQIAFALLDIGDMPVWWCAFLSVVVTAIVGGVKEAVDVKYGVPNVKDWAATFYGGLLGALLATLIAL